MVGILSVNCTLKWPNDLYEIGINYSLSILKNVGEEKLQQVEFLQREQSDIALADTTERFEEADEMHKK